LIRISVLAALAILVIACPILGVLTGKPALITFGTQVAIYALATMAVEIIFGNAGLSSLGQAGFFAIGGYVSGIISAQMVAGETIFGWAGTRSAPAVWLIAGATSGIFGFVIGLLCVRAKGSQFIMLTLAFGQLIHLFLVSLAPFGGDDGLLIQGRTEWPLIGVPSDLQFYCICWGTVIVAGILIHRLLTSRYGVTVNALRQNERRTESLGVRPVSMLLPSFALSAAIMGIAGAMWADFSSFVSPDMASWQLSSEFLSMSILGGVGSLQGALLGALAYVTMQTVFSILTDRWLLIFGGSLIVIVLFSRGGLYGFVERLASRVSPRC